MKIKIIQLLNGGKKVVTNFLACACTNILRNRIGDGSAEAMAEFEAEIGLTDYCRLPHCLVFTLISFTLETARRGNTV